MPWSGSGAFSPLYNWENDALAGIKILASRQDDQWNDACSNGLSNCLTRDGQGSAQSNLPMNGYIHTNVGNAVQLNQYAAAGQVQTGLLSFAVAGGTADAITASYSPAIATLVDGMQLGFRASASNLTTTPTFSPSGFTAYTIVKFGGVALSPSDIEANQECIVRYNMSATSWELLNPASILSVLSAVSVLSYGAVGNGSTDDTTAVTNAFDAVPAGGMLVFPQGFNFKISSVDVSGKTLTIFAYGSTITCTSASGAITKTDHGNTLTVLGGKWNATGSAKPIYLNMTPTAGEFKDFSIRDASFSSDNAYAITILGARFSIIDACDFTCPSSLSTGGGIYAQQQANLTIRDSHFRGIADTSVGTAIAINLDGIQSNFDAGPIIDNVIILGWGSGLIAKGNQDVVLLNSTVDYNRVANVLFQNIDGGNIRGCFIGTKNTAPALELSYVGALSNPPNNTVNVAIIGNQFVGHNTPANQNLIVFSFGPGSAPNYPQNVKITYNRIFNYTGAGIAYGSSGTYLLIDGNSFEPASGTTPIINSNGSGGDSEVIISNNGFALGTNLSGSGITFARLRGNINWVTEASGTSVTTGGTSSNTITHGMSSTPDFVSIATGAMSGTQEPTAVSVGSTTITVATASTHNAYNQFWAASKSRGI